MNFGLPLNCGISLYGIFSANFLSSTANDSAKGVASEVTKLSKLPGTSEALPGALDPPLTLEPPRFLSDNRGRFFGAESVTSPASFNEANVLIETETGANAGVSGGKPKGVLVPALQV